MLSPESPEIPFATPPSRDYYCPVCLEFLVDAYQLNCCGNHLCPVCNRRLTAGPGASCPICRLSEVKSTEDKFFKRLVLSLPVRCYHHEEGCQWKGELSELSDHYDHSRSVSCTFAILQCSFGCGQKIAARKMKTHKQEDCPKRPITCKHCQYHNSYNVVTEKHHPVCMEFPVECPNHCEKIVSESSLCTQNQAQKVCYPRKRLPEHLAKCPLQQIACTFFHVGCTARLPRCTMFTHLRDSKDKHMEYLMAALQASRRRVAELEEQVLVDSGGDSLPLPDPCVDSSLLFNLAPATFTMTEFSEKKAADVLWYSPPFFTSKMGYMMQMRVFANGDATGKGIHLSVFVFLMTGCYDGDLQWPFRGILVLELLNWRNNDNHCRKSIEFGETSSDSSSGRMTSRNTARSGRGKHKFIAHSELAFNPVTNTEFLQDDCLRFRIHTLIYSTPLAKLPGWQQQQSPLQCSQSLCECTLTEFSKHRLLGAEYPSRPFYTHTQGYKMRMKVFANGRGSAKGSHVSVYMYLMMGEYDQALQWPCNVALSVELLNWMEDKNHHKQIVPFSHCTKSESATRVTGQEQATTGPGLAQFASYDILPQFLQNDCLRFRITNASLQEMQ